ncbi:hypothetical protein GCM10008171_18830 [Methylopila jiangsuensis]|uniref:EAL domain-containing protein n=1 Tax=Methylopila jiangsuensis TaxID=586230 RepID=A0A9W6N343_9HYPH|nr:GGDEF domain-containing phosphodiesterase [Methylopila jiangsuensis]MDR6287143.1 diguanylate cyclase (GGDEF)-like protein [Methylopila jiangsuensis]GLK76629.1 hypothetical protein GCM10008171_18830 [Methylopila jiangsuensis]
MSLPNGASGAGWRRALPVRFTGLVALLLAALAGGVLAATSLEIRSAAEERALRAASRAALEGAGAIARGADPAAAVIDIRAAGAAFAYALDGDGALLAGGEPPRQTEAAGLVWASQALDRPGGGALRVAMSLGEASAEVGRVLSAGLVAALIVFALALPLAATLAARAVAPLRALSSAVRRASANDPGLRRAAARRDHVGALARAHLDLSRRLASSDAAVRRLTHDDALTGLPNLEALRRRLAERLQMGESAVLLRIEINGLGRVAIGLGEAASDQALVAAAERLRDATIRSGAEGGALTLARTGEAEFSLLAERATREAGDALARRALAAFDAPVCVEEQAVALSLCIGVAAAPLHGDEAGALMRSASAALASARAAGPLSVRWAGAALNDDAYGRLRMEQELRHAIAAGELELHYQPQIELASGKPLGAEALARWRHPTRGMIPPDRFIPVAEECGLVEALGRFVLETAARQAAAWAGLGFRLRIAVNVSAIQLRNPAFAETALAILREADCDPSLIELEITESAAMADADHAARQLAPLRAQGVRIAIDDFGTGYSNLASLTQLPFDVIKIDRGFVRDALEHPNARMVVAAVLGLAGNLGVETVAEGVETEEQRAFVAAHGCTYGQGYLFSRPVPAESLLAWRRNQLVAELRRMAGAAGGRTASEAALEAMEAGGGRERAWPA